MRFVIRGIQYIDEFNALLFRLSSILNLDVSKILDRIDELVHLIPEKSIEEKERIINLSNLTRKSM